jgi:type II secretory pathway component GspD/PulD (secretin)
MDLKEIVAISGMGGLFKIDTQRENGIIVNQLGDTKKKFVSNRQHMFTPLENITIFTQDEGMELKQVFEKMKKNETEHPVIDTRQDPQTIRGYFEKVVPEYDAERVYVSDIKKIIKWYHTLNENGLLVFDEKEDEKEKAPESKEEEKAD